MRGVRVVGGGAAALIALTGCSTVVDVAEPSLPKADAVACTKVVSDLPDIVDGQARRATKPGRLSAAWGDPAIVLTCGVAPPAAAGPTAACFEVNGVGWYAEQRPHSWVFYTLGRAVGVQVEVPAKYTPEANALVDLAKPIADHSKELQPCV